MKAIKRPIPIDVVKFPPDAGDVIPVDVTLRSSEKGRWEVWNALHASWVGFSEGDYLNVTNEQDVYPIEAQVFAVTYDVVDES